MDRPILIGAVAYDPRVVPIWEGMRDYFRAQGPPIDYVLFSNYDRQVDALLGRQIDVAWNTNLAWLKVHRRTNGACRALAMRDVDANFTTIFVARAGSGIRSLPDIRGQRLALGSADSAQAAILPVHFLQQAGVEAVRECTVLRFDLDVGKHGDTGTSELEVLRALRVGQADAGALGAATWIRQVSEGRIDPALMRPIWTSPGYSHCNFTVLGDFPSDLGQSWTESLLAMRYDDLRWRNLMDQEGLKRWLAAGTEEMAGYQVLLEAVQRQSLTRNWD
jgi:phosphonate transport system substrate-binding protein